MADETNKIDQADPDWFRQPTRREHWIGAALFIGFGVFFILLFALLRGWWFRWVILMLGIWSIWSGVRHVMNARPRGRR
jgi:fatty acid desaturase